MKKLIIKTGIYIGIIAVIFACNYAFNLYFIQKAPDLGGAEILVIGDSRMMTAINPEVLPQSVNTAQNSESYLISYYKLKRILPHNKSVKKVLLGFAYPSFSAYLDGIFKDDIATADVLNRIYPIMHISDFNGLEVDRKKYYQVYFKNMFVYPHTNHRKYMGGFSKLKPGLERADLEQVILRHYFDPDTNNIGISVCAARYLDSIVVYTREQGVELVLVNIPFYPAYENAVPENFKEYYLVQKEKYRAEGIKILDYGSLPMKDEYFKDHNHLAYEGANYFTEIIRKEIEE